MIQSKNGHINYDCGDTFENFDEEKLLNNYKSINCVNQQGSHFAPHVTSKNLWNIVKGFSEEFNPGIGSDPDFNMKLWNCGVRIFKGVNNFKVYHFVSTVINRINKPSKDKINIRSKANKIFLLKWRISIKFFKKFYLKTNSKYTGPLNQPKKDFFFLFYLLICKINYFYTKLFHNKFYLRN